MKRKGKKDLNTIRTDKLTELIDKEKELTMIHNLEVQKDQITFL